MPEKLEQQLKLTEHSLIKNGWKRQGANWYITLSFTNDPVVHLMYDPMSNKLTRIKRQKRQHDVFV